MPGHAQGQQAHQEFGTFDNFQAYPDFPVHSSLGQPAAITLVGVAVPYRPFTPSRAHGDQTTRSRSCGTTTTGHRCRDLPPRRPLAAPIFEITTVRGKTLRVPLNDKVFAGHQCSADPYTHMREFALCSRRARTFNCSLCAARPAPPAYREHDLRGLHLRRASCAFGLGRARDDGRAPHSLQVR